MCKQLFLGMGEHKESVPENLWVVSAFCYCSAHQSLLPVYRDRETEERGQLTLFKAGWVVCPRRCLTPVVLASSFGHVIDRRLASLQYESAVIHPKRSFLWSYHATGNKINLCSSPPFEPLCPTGFVLWIFRFFSTHQGPGQQVDRFLDEKIAERNRLLWSISGSSAPVVGAFLPSSYKGWFLLGGGGLFSPRIGEMKEKGFFFFVDWLHGFSSLRSAKSVSFFLLCCWIWDKRCRTCWKIASFSWARTYNRVVDPMVMVSDSRLGVFFLDLKSQLVLFHLNWCLPFLSPSPQFDVFFPFVVLALSSAWTSMLCGRFSSPCYWSLWCSMPQLPGYCSL